MATKSREFQKNIETNLLLFLQYSIEMFKTLLLMLNREGYSE